MGCGASGPAAGVAHHEAMAAPPATKSAAEGGESGASETVEGHGEAEGQAAAAGGEAPAVAAAKPPPRRKVPAATSAAAASGSDGEILEEGSAGHGSDGGCSSSEDEVPEGEDDYSTEDEIPGHDEMETEEGGGVEPVAEAGEEMEGATAVSLNQAVEDEPAEEELTDGNPLCFLDIEIGGEPAGTIEVCAAAPPPLLHHRCSTTSASRSDTPKFSSPRATHPFVFSHR